jgi:hypothetical protein
MGKGDSGWMQEGFVTPKDAPPNGGATLELPATGSFRRVSGMQTKLHGSPRPTEDGEILAVAGASADDPQTGWNDYCGYSRLARLVVLASSTA